MMTRLFLCTLVLTITAASCATETPGINPPEAELFFPTGLLYSEDTGTLFVTNGNSDLKYNGSTLMALDMEAILERITSGTVHPDCREDAENPGQVVCPLTGAMVRHAVRLGNYAGAIARFERPAGEESLFRLMVSVRGDPSLTWVDVKGTAGEVTCLDCGGGCEKKFPRDCDGAHTITTSEGLLSDPFRLLSFTREHPDYGTYNYVMATHLSEGGVTVVDVSGETGDPFVSHVMVDQFTPASSGAGTYDAIMASADASEIYISNALAPEIQSFAVRWSEEDSTHLLVPDGFHFYQAPMGPMESGSQIRGMDFNADRTRLYAAVRTPPMLYNLDMSPDETGKPSLEVLSYTELPMQPSVVRSYTGFGGREYLFVVSYPEGEMIVVDAIEGSIVQRIPVGSGPFEFTFIDNPLFKGIITMNYGESTIGFIIEEEGVFRRLGRLGEPSAIK